ncbi:uncharacterized protein [Macrobrachium rosenbergii]|uniref:uncharacterized protein n=1 Tax=Macrobrachium rosenbergii TaxID=79674 RepID=UPI0034D7A059
MLKNMGEAAETVYLMIVNKTYVEKSQTEKWNRKPMSWQIPLSYSPPPYSKKGIKEISWHGNKKYLQNREAESIFKGLLRFIEHENGTYREGDPFLFSVLMENLATLGFCPKQPGDIQLQKTQQSLYLTEGKCKELGLKINTNKTKAMAIKHTRPPNNLSIMGKPIEWVSDFMYLGVNINHKLSPANEIQHLKQKTICRLNAMRRISSLRQGASSHLLRMFYIQTTCSVVEYAVPALTKMTHPQVCSLEVIQNNAMKIIAGAPVWTKLCLLRAETNLLPLPSRIDQRNALTIVKTLKGGRDCPLRNKIARILNLHEELSPPRNYVGNLLATLRRVNMQEAAAATKRETPSDNYVEPPPWMPIPFKFHFTLLPANKQHCSPAQLRQAAQTAINNTAAPNVYYTDGSVDRNIPAAAAAVVSSSLKASWRLSNNASTLQTELVSIQKALEDSLNQAGNTTIHTDSKCAILAIKNQSHTENVHILTSIKAAAFAHQSNGRQVTLNWIPSHIGIVGNEEADQLAKSTLQCNTISIALNQSLTQMKQNIFRYCQNEAHSEIRQTDATSHLH